MTEGVERVLTTAGKLAWGAVLLVAVLHCDFWWWSSTRIVFGFLPLTLAYQVGITLAAAAVWTLVIRFAWPAHIERWAEREGGQR